ncbi:DUF4258 domain-containing protein [Enterobacter asburiae]|uniref:DUF4258 domain-containing protein n=1 Tax=Enterobacter asburiae TaxID=61645 RepID=UPI001C5AA328|nr:DUF4258 domain-containing protein [Enterobacter asburiae]MBW4210331.1 DUF4258 domain-containing protein [Enterobacter asburiae]
MRWRLFQWAFLKTQSEYQNTEYGPGSAFWTKGSAAAGLLAGALGGNLKAGAAAGAAPLLASLVKEQKDPSARAALHGIVAATASETAKVEVENNSLKSMMCAESPWDCRDNPLIEGGGSRGAYNPTGRSGNPMNTKGSNSPAVIGERAYSTHAVDRMQGRGVPPSAVENTIKTGNIYPTKPGTTGYYDATNNLRVIINTNTGDVVTVIPGGPTK